MPVILREESFSDPKYIFFLKKVNYPRNSRGYLEIPNHEKEKISLLLKTFKLNKLKDCAIPIENPANEED